MWGEQSMGTQSVGSRKCDMSGRWRAWSLGLREQKALF